VVITIVGTVGGRSGAAIGDSFGVAALAASGVLALVNNASIMRCTVGAGVVVLGGLGRGMSESITVGALDVWVILGRFLNLDTF